MSPVSRPGKLFRRRRKTVRTAAVPIERWLDYLVEGAWDWDIARGRVRHNETWCAMLGVGADLQEHPVEWYWRFVHPEDVQRVLACIEAALQSGRPIRHEYRMCRADGAVLWVIDRGAVIERAADGTPTRMVGSLLDVTAERLRQQEKDDATQSLQLALKAGELGLWDWCYESGRLVVDERWKQMLGLPVGHTVHTVDEWARLVHPADVPKLQAIVRDIIEKPGGGDFSVEVRALHSDGHWVWILDQGLVAQRDGDGRPLRIIGTHRDVTAQRETARLLEQQRQQLKTVVDTAFDAMVSIDSSHRIVVFNHAAERMFGVPASEAIGGSFDRFMPADMRGGLHDRLMTDFVVSGGKSRVIHSGNQATTMAVRADGTAFPIEASVSRSGSEDVLLTAIIRDVSELRRAREAMHEKERAQRANEAKSKFLSRVSHELRTPLNAILGFAQLMRDADPHTAKRHTDHLLQAGQRLLDLVNDLLDLGRIESGRHELKLQPVSVASALSQVGQLVSAEVLRRGMRLVVELDDDDGMVVADARALDQILLNLLSNALKFSPMGSTVWLRASTQQAPVRIAVSDEGPGIPESSFDDLFTPYSRLQSSFSQVPGTGLGLAISRDLARQMGGDLVPSRAPGGGTCMTVTLPRAIALVPSAAAANGISDDPASRGASQGREDAGRALIVEDDPASAVLLEHLFHLAGAWTVRSAATITEALEILREDSFDLVLTDMDVAGEDGIQIIEAVRSLPEAGSVTLVAVTADAMPAQVQRVRAAGADGCWCKPVDVQQVLAFLRSRNSRWPALLASP